MTQSNKVPEPRLRQDVGTKASGHGGNAGEGDARLRPNSPVLRSLRVGTSPLSWWRTMPADAFRAADHFHVCSACEELAMVLEGAEVEAALLGDPDLAIEFVFSVMPVSQLTLKVDIAMTSVLRCALDGDLRAALVLAHIVDRIDLDLPLAAELCASWLEHYLRFSPTRGGLTPAEKAVMKALREFDCPRHHNGADA